MEVDSASKMFSIPLSSASRFYETLVSPVRTGSQIKYGPFADFSVFLNSLILRQPNLEKVQISFKMPHFCEIDTFRSELTIIPYDICVYSDFQARALPDRMNGLERFYISAISHFVRF